MMDTGRWDRAVGTRGRGIMLRTVLFLAVATLMATAALGQTKPEGVDQPPEEAAATPPSEPASSPAQQPQPGKPAPAKPDKIGDILKQLDPAKLNLSGAEVDMEVVGDQLILRGNQSDLDVIELLITLLEGSTEQKVLRVVTVTEKDANDIARTVGESLKRVLSKPNQRPEDELSVSALSSRILLVAALPDDIDLVVETIQAVDVTPDIGLPPLEQLVFPIKNRKAADVAKQLKEIVAKMQERVGATGAKSNIQIIANNANNSVMILAPETEREKIQKLLNEIDVEPAKGFGEVKLTLFPLTHSKPSDLAKMITDLLTTPQGKEAAEEVIQRLQISKSLPSGEVVELPPIDLQRPTKIIADEGTGSLIIATAEENIGPMTELIRLLDGVPMSEAVALKLFPLRFADAETLVTTFKSMFDGGKKLTEDPDGSGQNAVPPDATGKALVYNVGLFSDARTNTLIVTGRPEHLELVANLVRDLDLPSSALKFPLRLFPLQRTDVAKVEEILTKLFDQRIKAVEATGATKAALERERVFLTADVRSNALIVSASEENASEIEGIVKQLDSRPSNLFDQIRLVNLDRLSAQKVKEKIDELWQRKAKLRQEAEQKEDLPVVAIDERSNSLIVAASMEDYEEIAKLVETLEKQPLTDDTQFFSLQFADATVVADMLDKLFEGIAGEADGFNAPTTLPDPRSNSLVVAGSRDALERAAELVRRFDVQAGPMTAIFKVYPLLHASAMQLSQRMQTLFDSRQQGGGETPRTPIVILSDETSNSLVASASRDDHETIVNLLSLLDRPSSLAKQFEIFPLKMARAAQVAEGLSSLFTAQGEGGAGRADAISTQADERTNSVIVWASPSQMANIKEVIERLDTAAPVVEMQVKVVQLKQALAQDFADLLQRTLTGQDGGGGGGGDAERAIILSWAQKQKDGSEMVRKLLRQDIRVEADPRTNSLMVVAPSDSVDMLEAMIRDFDAIRPTRSELRLFPLINADARSMAEQLTELFQSEQTGGGGEGQTKSQLIFGGLIGSDEVASVGQELRFASDSRTNTLIAAGAEVDLRMVEEFVRYLDSQEAEARVSQVYQAKFRDAQELATAIQGFNDKEQSVVGEGDSEEAQTRRQERQISIESLGTPDEGSSNLILGVHPRKYQQTMDLLQQLDRAEPQVQISVTIAEVTLTNNFELGVEIAGQELDFTRAAVLGPNGVIEGSDFDFVGGSNLNAAGSGLGLNFTITGEDFSFLLHALQSDSRVAVLSHPNLLVRNGQEGNITIADQVPFVQSSQINDTGSTNSTIGRENVGIVLTATPTISPDGYVTIELHQEISSFAGENLQLTEGVSSPIFQTRQLQTNITVRDGETVVVGGLITDRRSEGETRVPILGDLPLLGPLFRTTNSTENKTELLIVMTVDILRTDDDTRRMAAEIRDRYDLPDAIKQSPLMGGLRIRPDEKLLGPVPPHDPPAKAAPTPEERELYGPRPKTYGPVVPKAAPATTGATPSEAPVYGPKVVRNDAAAEPG